MFICGDETISKCLYNILLAVKQNRRATLLALIKIMKFFTRNTTNNLFILLYCRAVQFRGTYYSNTAVLQ